MNVYVRTLLVIADRLAMFAFFAAAIGFGLVAGVVLACRLFRLQLPQLVVHARRQRA